MKLTITNVENNEKQATQQRDIIIAEAVERFAQQGAHVEDIKVEEVATTVSFKIAGSNEYYVASVEHDDLSEMLEVTLDLESMERSDNEEESRFNEEDRAIVNGEIPKYFEEIEPTFDLKEMTLRESETIKDMVIMRFDHNDGFEVARVYQDIPNKDMILIQEYSIKEK